MYNDDTKWGHEFGNVDANLQLIVKKIPLIGICIVGYTVRVHVIFYLGDGVWILDEVTSCTLPKFTISSLLNISNACRTFFFVKVSFFFSPICCVAYN